MQIFETRYLDMVSRCLKESTGFGVVMIVEGEQVLSDQGQQTPTISHCGTYCTIVDFDEAENGCLSIMVEGQSKFAIRDHYEQHDRLLMAQVEFLAVESQVAVPAGQAHLCDLLVSLMEHKAIRCLGLSCDTKKATEVGARLTEFLPCPNQFKQRLLEMKDPLVRLQELEKLIERLS